MKRLSLIFLVLFGWTNLGAQDFSRVRIEILPLEENLHLFYSRAGGNLLVCTGEDGVLLVDSEYAELTDKVRQALAGITDQKVRFVINTHWHFDHVGGNESFKKEGALILAQEKVRTRMAVDQTIGLLDVDVPASPDGALPDLCYRDQLTLHLNGEEIRLLHMPRAHTDGDTVVHLPGANVIHMGDIVFNPGYPFIERSANGNINGVIEAIEKVLGFCDDETRIIPGHGPLAGQKDLEAYLEMLKTFRLLVAQEMAAGKNLEEILKAQPTRELDQTWGKAHFPPHLFTEMVYDSLKSEEHTKAEEKR